MSDTRALPARRHDLDWLRVIAIVLLVFFHAAMPFVAEWWWHLKNAETSHLLLEVNFFMSRWRMALLFLISGVGTAYALGRRTAGTFARERAKRLVLPLVFGILFIVPPQIYIERIAHGQAWSSYLAFWPSIFTTGPYPKGNLSWHHLWFVGYLAIYTALLLPLFAWLRGARLERAGAWMDRAAGRVGLPALALPLAIVFVTLVPHFEGLQDVVHDLAMFTYYGIFFAYGYMMSRAAALWERIERERAASLRWAVLATLAVNYLRWNRIDVHVGLTPGGVVYGSLLALMAWCWVITILGYGKRYLSRGSAFLTWANEGIYPVYILHQTVIVILAYYIVPLNDGIFSKFFFLSFLSLAVTYAIYEVLVRPFNPVRVLFGMKRLPREGAAAGRGTAYGPVPRRAKAASLAWARMEMATWGSE